MPKSRWHFSNTSFHVYNVYLNGKGLNGRNHIQTTSTDMLFWEQWIILPDCLARLDHGNMGDLAHEVFISELHRMNG